jgi:hypothetical protein
MHIKCRHPQQRGPIKNIIKLMLNDFLECGHDLTDLAICCEDGSERKTHGILSASDNL